VVVNEPAPVPVNAPVAIVTTAVSVSVPVYPRYAPVPPVITRESVPFETVPLLLPMSVKVPNRVPPAKVSVTTPVTVKQLSEHEPKAVTVPLVVTVYEPNGDRVPVPEEDVGATRLPLMETNVPVVEVPMNISDVVIVLASAGKTNALSAISNPAIDPIHKRTLRIVLDPHLKCRQHLLNSCSGKAARASSATILSYHGTVSTALKIFPNR
jgi:hypothetical protein